MGKCNYVLCDGCLYLSSEEYTPYTEMGKAVIKKRVKQVNKLEELPEELRNFIDGIMIKENETPAPNRRPRKKKEVVVREDPRKKLVNTRVKTKYY